MKDTVQLQYKGELQYEASEQINLAPELTWWVMWTAGLVTLIVAALLH